MLGPVTMVQVTGVYLLQNRKNGFNHSRFGYTWWINNTLERWLVYVSYSGELVICVSFFAVIS